MDKVFILKNLVLGCLIGLISALFGSFIFISLFTEYDFQEGINSLKESGHLGKLITLGALFNVIIFFVLLKFNKEIIARGMVLATIILTIITLFV